MVSNEVRYCKVGFKKTKVAKQVLSSKSEDRTSGPKNETFEAKEGGAFFEFFPKRFFFEADLFFSF